MLIEKPPRGDFLPIVDGGYALQYSPLLEYREGRGLVLFCQMDVTARTESDPAAETLAGNILRYVDAWRPAPRRTAVYAGEPAGLAWLAACGVEAAPFKGEPPAADQVLVVGPGGGRAACGSGSGHRCLGQGGRPRPGPRTGRGGGELLPADEGHDAACGTYRRLVPPFQRPIAAGRGSAGGRAQPRPAQAASGGGRRDGLWRRGAGGDGQRRLLPTPAVPSEQSDGGAEFARGDRGYDTAGHKKSALVSLGSLVSAQFGQKLPAGEIGKTYTFAACVKALGGPAVVRLEVERAGRPWDRAARGPDITVSPGDWTEVHLTFPVDKAYPEGWQAYLNGSGEGARFQVDRMRLYEGPYVPKDDPAAAATEAPDRNLFKNVNFEAGLASWYFNHGPEQFNLRRTFGRTSFAVSRLLGNLGVSGSTPLLERFADPVGASKGPSVVKNGDFSHGCRRRRPGRRVGVRREPQRRGLHSGGTARAGRRLGPTHHGAARRGRRQGAGSHDRPTRDAHPRRPVVSLVAANAEPRV